MLFCLNIFVLGLMVVPAGVCTFFWYKERSSKPFPTAAWGAGLMLFSFFFLPWLNLSPLKLIDVEVIYDLLPFASFLLQFGGLETAAEAVESVGVLDFLLYPRGWLTLAMVTRPLMWVATLALGGIVYVLAVLVTARPQVKELGPALTIGSAILLLILFIYLPIIDGLGERTFPELMAVVAPILGAHILWIGPAVMFIAFGAMIYAGLRTWQDAGSFGSVDELDDDNLEGELWTNY